MTTTDTTTPTTTRLHITPFNPDLLPAVLPASLQSTATEISFHTLPTFPEKNYGYVTLPTMEAEKIKKKLHGSILKGKKFKIEPARPEKEKKRDENETEDVEPDSSSKKKKSKKRKAEDGVLGGHELGSDRKVKRGWTESTEEKAERRKEEKRKGKEEKKKEKLQAKSKYTEKEECLFRTQLPPNKSFTGDEKQDKKLKKKKKSGQDSVVHEFANTISHPSFLRSAPDGTAPTATFEEEKGWVDDSGKVKETASKNTRDPQYRPGKVAGAKEKPKPKAQKSAAKELKPAEMEESAESEDWTSSSGSSDDSDPESDEGASSDSSDAADGSPGQAKEEQQPHPDTLETPNPDITLDKDESPKELHPLESVFKHRAPGSSENQPAAETNGQFSFFGNDDIESDEEPTALAEPHTPFAKEDFQNRGMRSAAPTPDTGLVGRTMKWDGSEADAMDEDDDSSVGSPVSKKSGGEGEETEFAQWFWENRGDNNRAWKRRRREAAKEERQRENRRKGMKGKS